jgi:hypothetical protein
VDLNLFISLVTVGEGRQEKIRVRKPMRAKKAMPIIMKIFMCSSWLALTGELFWLQVKQAD